MAAAALTRTGTGLGDATGAFFMGDTEDWVRAVWAVVEAPLLGAGEVVLVLARPRAGFTTNSSSSSSSSLLSSIGAALLDLREEAAGFAGFAVEVDALLREVAFAFAASFATCSGVSALTGEGEDAALLLLLAAGLAGATTLFLDSASVAFLSSLACLRAAAFAFAFAMASCSAVIGASPLDFFSADAGFLALALAALLRAGGIFSANQRPKMEIRRKTPIGGQD